MDEDNGNGGTTLYIAKVISTAGMSPMAWGVSLSRPGSLADASRNAHAMLRSDS